LLLISLLPPYDNVVLGCFLNTSISPPSLSIRGDYTSTIFNLNLDAPRLHKWCGEGGHVNGKKLGQRVADDIANENIDDVDNEGSTIRQFAVATNHYITVGGSKEHATNALRLDDNLKYVHTGYSDTFNNSPLLERIGEEGTSTTYQFEVENVELWCGTHSVESARRSGKLSDDSSSVLSK